MSEPESVGNIADQKLDSMENVSSGNHGGPRPNSGRPLGSVNKATKDVKQAKKHFVDRVNKHVDEIFNAQLDLAKGEKYLMVITTTGKGSKQRRETTVVTDPDLIRQFLDEELEDSDTEYYFMTTKPANNMAMDSLLNRSFGKATEKVELDTGFFKATKMVIEVVGEDYDDNSGTTDSTPETEQETETSTQTT